MDESAPLWLPSFVGAAGLVLLTIGALSSIGRFPRNFLAGIRTSLTLANDRAWAAGHKAAATLLMASGLVTMSGAAVFGVLRTSDWASTVVIVTLVAVLGLLWQALRVANRAARPLTREATVGRVASHPRL